MSNISCLIIRTADFLISRTVVFPMILSTSTSKSTFLKHHLVCLCSLVNISTFPSHLLRTANLNFTNKYKTHCKSFGEISNSCKEKLSLCYIQIDFLTLEKKNKQSLYFLNEVLARQMRVDSLVK